MKSGSITGRLLFLGVVALPFQQAFTLNIGFPLKLTELLFGIAFLFSLFSPISYTNKVASKYILFTLAGLVTLSFVINADRSVSGIQTQGYEKGFFFDIAQYTIYALFAIFTCFLVARRLGRDEIARAVSISIRLAAAYCLAQVILDWLNLSILENFNGTKQVGQSFGGVLTRNGPFLEGNYLAMYAGAAIFITAGRRDKLGVVLASACLIYSQSTIGIIGMVAALLLLLASKPRARFLAGTLGVGALAITLIQMVPQAQNYLTTQLAKIGIVESQNLAYVENSLNTRSNTADAGFRMGFDNPFFGVGPGRFGVWFSEFESETGSALSRTTLDYRPIANNNYAQVMSELGVVALILFVLIFILTIKRNVRKNSTIAGLGVFLLICNTASPAWTVLTLWVGMAYMISVPDHSHNSSADFRGRVSKNLVQF